MKDKFEILFPDDGSSARFRGFWRAEKRQPDGTLSFAVGEYPHVGTNVVTTVGKDFVTSFLVSAVVAASTFTCKYVAVGTGATAETASDTGLVSELARTTGTVTHNGQGIYQVVASFNTNSATGAIAEYGIFSSSTGGVLLARDTESVLNITSVDTLTVTAQVTLS